MMKTLTYILALFISIMPSYATTTITYTSDYGINNIILFIFLVTVFFFWIWIFVKFTEPLEYNKMNILKSLTNIIIKFICWIWYIALLYVFQGVLFISSGDSFLTDKLDLLYGLIILTVVILGVVALFNGIKLSNKMIGVTEFFREFVYELKTGGRK